MTPAPLSDPIDGTKWLGTLSSPTGTTPFALEFRRSPKGALYLVETLPVMHIYSQLVSRVTPRAAEYVFDDLPGSARIEGNTLRGVALYAKMPFQLERISELPAPAVSSPGTLPAGPASLWSRSLGAAAWASPVIREGVLYLGTVDGRVHALRARDGHDVWTWSDSTPIYGDALVTGDAVFIVNDRTELIRLDRKSGTLRWRVPLDSGRRTAARIPDDDTFNHRTATPVLADGVLYVGSTDGGMFALDPATGATTWRIDAGSKICAPVAVVADRVLVGTLAGTLLALRRVNGKELWRRTTAAGIVSAPVVYRDRAVVGSRDFLLRAYRVADGRELWSQHFWSSWVESTPRVLDGVMYIGSSDLRAVRALDPATGTLKWSTDVYGAAYGAPVVTEGAVYIGVVGLAGYLIDHRASIVALDRGTGAIRWARAESTPVGTPIWGHPGTLTFANHTLYAAGLDGIVLALPAR